MYAAPLSYFSVTVLCAVRAQNFTDRTVAKAARSAPNRDRAGGWVSCRQGGADHRFPPCTPAIRSDVRVLPHMIVSSHVIVLSYVIVMFRAVVSLNVIVRSETIVRVRDARPVRG